MSYCAPTWTSDYQFTNALRYRVETETSSIVVVAADTRAAAPSRTLLVWGGLDREGAPYLKPAFFIDAPPAPPASDGAWSLTGRDAGGGELFSVSLGMTEYTDTEDGHAGFTLALPVTWSGPLASISLEGPTGSAHLDHDTDTPVTILRDGATGPDPRYRGWSSGGGPGRGLHRGGRATGARSPVQPRDPGQPESRPTSRRRIMTRARLLLSALGFPRRFGLGCARRRARPRAALLDQGRAQSRVSGAAGVGAGGRPDRLDRVRRGEAQRLHGGRARLRAGAR